MKIKVKKRFSWKDKSGRGFSNTWSISQLKKAMAHEKNYNGTAASTWAAAADVGDEWENAANKIVRIDDIS